MALFDVIEITGARVRAGSRTRRLAWLVLWLVARHAIRVWLEAPHAMPGRPH
jgi:hypothetical protein